MTPTQTGNPAAVTFGGLTPERDAAALVISLQTFVALYDHRQGPVAHESVEAALGGAAALLMVMGQPLELESPLVLGVPPDHRRDMPTAQMVWDL